MDSTSTQRPWWTYDVFVSFRGKDIRKGFMDHLFEHFEQKGILAFRDDKYLTLGENISPNLDKVIQESRFLMVIFSKNYASSSWCLRELVKILECNETSKHKHELRIIFYDVKPDVVRKQTGSYAEAFAKHEISNKAEIAKWKEALSMAANLSGWDLQDVANGFESKFIASISGEILKAYSHVPLHVGENLVGVDVRVNQMNLLRFVGSNKVHMIGICGISGIGKTTLAKAVYNSMSIHFEKCSFCEDVQGVAKQQGLTQVQRQLIGKIMKTRAVEVSSVSEGVMIIKQRMPTKPVLIVLDDVDHRDQLEALAGSHDWFFPGSLIIFTGKDKQLLSSHKVDEIYDMPVLPDHRALELFSLYAFGEQHPRRDFKELCYQVVRCLQGHPLALRVLGGCLYNKPMHVWQSEVDKLQACPNAEIQRKLRPSFDGLDFDQKRIFLDIACSFIGENRDFVASVLDSDDCFPNGSIEVLVDKSLISISRDDNSLQMHELIRGMAREIVREESKWSGHRSRLWIPSEVQNVLNENTAMETVEVLDLLQEESSEKVHIDGKAFECCENLVKVHPSFGMLKKLVVLNMRDCRRFKRFPCKVEMDSLEVLHISGCSELDKLPESFGKIQTLREFFADGTALAELNSFFRILSTQPSMSDSIGGLSCLEYLNLDGNNFTSLPGCLSQLSHLKRIELFGCKKLEVLPQLPPNLWQLDASDCTSLYQLSPNRNYNISSSLIMLLYGCTKLFRDVSIERKLCISQPRPDLNSSITFQSWRNQISSFLQSMELPNNTCGIFGRQEEKFSNRGLDITYYGDTIPQWFTNTTTENHIKVELPPNICYNKVRGHGICVVLTQKNACGHKSYLGSLTYSIKNFDGTSLLKDYLYFGSIKIHKQDIILFHFVKSGSWEWMKAKNFVTFSLKENDGIEVKEFGVRLVFDEDIQGEDTSFSIPQDLPTPTQDEGYIIIGNGGLNTLWSW
ncbi:hypothetical protein OSB04_028486 [Centaurea solstitialis]|uniref:ADP-ribosyl cyclase/cyclic ADP-ribose hydrolase n=1 Tax=Centaurea solstitialis TaxID=347529 RepID=A0AA38SFU9_9ASTR|nr:hypothetical protein OSB04_028486 [Centaurea solstitialis]